MDFSPVSLRMEIIHDSEGSLRYELLIYYTKLLLQGFMDIIKYDYNFYLHSFKHIAYYDKKIFTYMIFIHVYNIFHIKLILIIYIYGFCYMKEIMLYYSIFSLKCSNMSTH